MSIINRETPETEVRGALLRRGDLAVVVVGCDKCAKTSRTGGSEQVKVWKQQLCGAGLKCVSDVLPGMHIVPGLNTLGPGVRDQLACLAPETKAETRPPRPGVLPQLRGDIVMHMEPEGVISIFRLVMDDDREEALSLVRDRLYRQVECISERPSCSVAFEMERTLSGGS